MLNAEVILPAAPMAMCSRRLVPTSVLCTSNRASVMGVPIRLMNSRGAAPVPPSPPSTTMKSGVFPVSSMALTMANHSQGWPIASLKPTGLPPDSSRSFSRNSRNSLGVENAEWLAGETTSLPASTPRASAISGVTFSPGRMPPCPGLAPWDSLTSIIFTWSRVALRANLSSLKVPSLLRHPK